MTAEEFKKMREKKGYSQEQLRHALARGVKIIGGEILRVCAKNGKGGPMSHSAIEKWEQDSNPIGETVAIVMRLLPHNPQFHRKAGNPNWRKKVPYIR
jgi:transcriptional regulator with XRE-family HTH domain